jgi:hypothetical protein
MRPRSIAICRQDSYHQFVLYAFLKKLIGHIMLKVLNIEVLF